MQAKETKLQDLLEGTKQFVLPLFQRAYSWEIKEWNTLWKDILDLLENNKKGINRNHFFGSIVSVPIPAGPEEIAKFNLIDGQQRLTTIFILLILLRDLSKNDASSNLSEEINRTLIVNPYKIKSEHFKLIPTQVDRIDFKNLVNSEPRTTQSTIFKAYDFFKKKFIIEDLDKNNLKRILTSSLTVVSILLDINDNSYLVFESLNAKGRSLTQADLIKNYCFMCIDVETQQQYYDAYWSPMESRLKDKLTEFIRHYLMIDGSIIKSNEVYSAIKIKINRLNVIEFLGNLNKASINYKKLLNPDEEKDELVKKSLKRLNRLEITTVYPLVLKFYDLFINQRISTLEFSQIIGVFENYLIRRYICNEPTNQLNKIFPSVINSLINVEDSKYLSSLKSILSGKRYPKDNAFINSICESKFYGSTDKPTKTKLILDSIEESYNHKERITLTALSIEHIMPQTLTDWWKAHLGDSAQSIHEQLLHNIGNLTMTGYNSELSNSDFSTKKRIYSDSRLKINEYFNDLTEWKNSDILLRAKTLSEKILQIWPYFGEKNKNPNLNGATLKDKIEIAPVQYDTNKKTISLVKSTEPFDLETILQYALEKDNEKFNILMTKYPGYLNSNFKQFKKPGQLKDKIYYEKNLSTSDIRKFCLIVLDFCDINYED